VPTLLYAMAGRQALVSTAASRCPLAASDCRTMNIYACTHGADRPVSLRVETMGLPASAAMGNPDRWDLGCIRVYRPINVLASRLGRCDGRHKLPFEYPIIFWTP